MKDQIYSLCCFHASMQLITIWLIGFNVVVWKISFSHFVIFIHQLTKQWDSTDSLFPNFKPWLPCSIWVMNDVEDWLTQFHFEEDKIQHRQCVWIKVNDEYSSLENQLPDFRLIFLRMLIEFDQVEEYTKMDRFSLDQYW